MKPLFLSIIFLGLLRCFSCYKIIFMFPFPSRSHYISVSHLAEELARRGHEVTMLSPFPRSTPVPNYHDISIDAKKLYGSFMQENNMTSWRHQNLFSSVSQLWVIMPNLLEAFLNGEAAQTLIHSNATYDLMIGESGFFQPSILGFAHKFNAHTIEFSSVTPFAHLASIIGNPHSFSYIPSLFLSVTDRMTFLERMHNMVIEMYQILVDKFYFIPSQDTLMCKYFSQTGGKPLPPLQDLLKNISLTLVNTHPTLNYPRPFASNVVQIGGYHLKPAKKLPSDLQTYMDESKDGVIYFSFGSNVRPNAISRERLETFVAALKSVKQRVLMKWEDYDDPVFKGANNILVKAWLPQQEILVHPKCVLFITHGGYNSQLEVMSTGVPVIGFPFFADQFHNVLNYERLGIGKAMDLESFNREKLLDTINTIIETPSFRENAKEILKRMQDQPDHPMDRAVFWVEYVIRHKGAHHLKPASVYLPYYQYILLDVIAFISAIGFVIVYLIYVLVSICFCPRKKYVKKQRENLSKKNT